MTLLTLPILLGAPETGGIVQHTTGKGLSSSPHHVPQLVQTQLVVSWILLHIHPTSLESSMPHLRVEGKELESRVAGETAVVILHQVLEVVPDGDWDLTMAQEVSCSSGEEGGEGTSEVALSGELIERNTSD